MKLHAVQLDQLPAIQKKYIHDQVRAIAHTPFTQAPWYASWHKVLGREVIQIAIVDTNNLLYGYTQYIKLNLTGSLSLLYAPYGPLVFKEPEAVIDLLITESKEIAKRYNAICTRFDPTPLVDAKIFSKYKRCIKTPHCAVKGSIIQPRREWILSLAPSEDDLLAGMHKKTRYDIRSAEKSGVTIEIISHDCKKYTKDFYDVLQETSKRNSFHLHPRAYYDAVLETIDTEKSGYLVVARIHEEIVTIHAVVFFGDTAMYVFGGTKNKNREIPSSHLAELHSIFYAKSRGLSFYNMGGMSTDDYPDPSLEDVTRFKKRFGGQELHHSELYDIIHKPLWYYIYIVRKWISSKLK